MKDSLTQDAVEKFLREKRVSMLVENGGMCLVPLQGMQKGLNFTFDSHDAKTPALAGQ